MSARSRRRHAGVAQHPGAHRPLAGRRSSSSGTASPYGSSSNAPSSIASRIWRSTRLSHVGPTGAALGIASLRLMRDRSDRVTGELTRPAGTCGDVQTIDGRPVYSATDLVAYLACEHLTQLERAALAGLAVRPMRDDPELDVIRKRGFQHEAALPRRPARRGRDGDQIEQDGSIEDRGDQLRAAAARDRRRDGAGRRRHLPGDVLRRHVARPRRLPAPRRRRRTAVALRPVPLRGRRHQARPPRQGQRRPPDLLVRRPARADPGRPTRVAPRRARRQRPRVERLRVDDYMAYYRSAASRFLATLADETPPPSRRRRPTRSPSSTATSAAGRPNARAPSPRRRSPEPRRRDHRPASGGRSATAASRRSRRSATSPLPMDPQLEGTSERALARVREQARIQLEGRASRRTSVRAPAAAAGRGDRARARPGLAPAASPGDLFFDIEGDPYAFDDGLDYLFGVLDDRWHVPRVLVARRDRRVHARRRAARLRAPDRLHHRAARRATRRSTSTTTRRTSRPRSSG